MLEQDIFSDFIVSEILDVDQKLLEEELETIKENFPSTNRSNIGGYQSPLFGSLGIAVPYPYQQFDILLEKEGVKYNYLDDGDDERGTATPHANVANVPNVANVANVCIGTCVGAS